MKSIWFFAFILMLASAASVFAQQVDCQPGDARPACRCENHDSEAVLRRIAIECAGLSGADLSNCRTHIMQDSSQRNVE